MLLIRDLSESFENDWTSDWRTSDWTDMILTIMGVCWDPRAKWNGLGLLPPMCTMLIVAGVPLQHKQDTHNHNIFLGILAGRTL